MGRYVAKRLGRGLLTLALMSVIVFGLTRIMGDPVSLLVPADASEETRQQVRERLGLDEPLLNQFLDFLQGALQGNFGESLYYGVSSRALLLDALPATLLLAATAAVIALLLGVLLGTIAAVKPRSWLDTLIGSVSMGGISTPAFWAALLLIFWFGVDLGLLPTSGYGTWQHLVLPAVVLSIRPIGSIAQVTRSAMLDELQRDYVVTGFSKGLLKGAVVRRHVLKNASMPMITMAGIEIADMMTGVIVVETVFNWPGVGSLAAQSMDAIDYPVIQTVVFWAASITIIVNLVVDLSYAWLDPRTRHIYSGVAA